MTFGEDWGWGVLKEECARILDVYCEVGGNFIDIVNCYIDGLSELIIGELLGEDCDEFVLVTKFGFLMCGVMELVLVISGGRL